MLAVVGTTSGSFGCGGAGGCAFGLLGRTGAGVGREGVGADGSTKSATRVGKGVLVDAGPAEVGLLSDSVEVVSEEDGVAVGAVVVVAAALTTVVAVAVRVAVGAGTVCVGVGAPIAAETGPKSWVAPPPPIAWSL